MNRRPAKLLMKSPIVKRSVPQTRLPLCTSFAAEPAPSAVSLDYYSVNQTFAHRRKRILGSLPMSKNEANTRLPATVIEHEARANGALTVCDALHLAKPMFHAISRDEIRRLYLGLASVLMKRAASH